MYILALPPRVYDFISEIFTAEFYIFTKSSYEKPYSKLFITCVTNTIHKQDLPYTYFSSFSLLKMNEQLKFVSIFFTVKGRKP